MKYNISRWVRLCAGVICITGAACNSNIVNGNKSAATRSAVEVRDICEISKDSSLSEGQFIRVKGEVTGYHELVLYSKNCPETNNFIELNFEPDERARLFDLSRKFNTEKTDVVGVVTVYGRFSPNGGQLFNYPPRTIDLKGPPKQDEGVKVNKMSQVKLEDFSPS
jgi:hypothetical protein